LKWEGKTLAQGRKPPPDLVSKAAKALKHPEEASKRTIKRMAAEILDDQEWNPKPAFKKQSSR
jgi:hypothetical protein